MTPSQLLYDFVDQSLVLLKENGFMKTPHPNMPKEMIDETIKQESDWIPWKPIPSIVTENDLKSLEDEIQLEFPNLYKEFLMYKHFYDLDHPNEISFYRHCVRDWKKDLLDMYFNSYEPDEIIRKGFIPFADYSDWGIVCFNTNKRTATNNNDCEIVMIDHELLYDDPVPKEKLYPSFAEMIKDLKNLQNLNSENQG